MDADWAGSLKHRSSNDPLSTHSHTGYCISCACCPLVWKDKLQSIIAVSTTEAEYATLSTVLRQVIVVVHSLHELESNGLPIHKNTPKITYMTFEDNMRCLKIATEHKSHPKTKNLPIRLHHFRSFVVKKLITIKYISTRDQVADIFTKYLPIPQFQKLKKPFYGWWLQLFHYIKSWHYEGTREYNTQIKYAWDNIVCMTESEKRERENDYVA